MTLIIKAGKTGTEVDQGKEFPPGPEATLRAKPDLWGCKNQKCE